MNVLQICFAYPPSFSGYGKQLKTVNDSLLKNNKDIEINIITAFDGEEHKNNQNIYSFFNKDRKSYKNHLLMHYTFSFFYFLKFFRLFLKADVIHAIKAGPEAAIAVIIAKVLRKPVIVKIVQNELEIENKGFINKLRLQVITKWSTRIIAISPKIEENLYKNSVEKNRIVLINNSIDTDRFFPVKDLEKKEIREKHNIGNDDLVFMFLGSITKRKGIHDLLNSLARVNFIIPCTLLFIGPNYNEIQNFEEVIKKITEKTENLEIKYIPFTKSPEQFFHLSDFLILPSYSEGMPNVVLEALSSELPVLLSDIDVHKSICDSKFCRLFRVSDEISLSEEIQKIIINPDMLLSNKTEARRFVLENNTVKIISNKYLALYKDLIND
ncbi:glycosyltransferase family 4 protein [Arcobacter arenosus]|uniref:Glycosyltransferase family 4 protein n=1 Tax=Arcobacter arenosus TaxID=2576037 RepID=A0A5R8XYS0_9BACT|nr:glycosyltransferase family 4 protein [Arcobacter arenosus]TLP36818.1 glycosyltransferase family 4 protein [Arcobacter arenosus]